MYYNGYFMKLWHWIIESPSIRILYDRTLLWLILGLSCVGFIMVSSSSMSIGVRLLDDEFYFIKHYALYLNLIFLSSWGILRIPMALWQRYSTIILLFNVIMLFIVLLIGNAVNGASRWIIFGPLHIQPAEFSKLGFFCYLSSYLMRKSKEITTNLWSFLKPMGVMAILAILLLLQPDFGTVVIIFVTTVAILFLAGAKLWQFLSIISTSVVFVVFLIISEPYRMQRVISFWHPWEDPFGSGYQLTQSLMAFGRGEFWGQGLGNSIQKLEYLPEAHTDFIFAILGEELGFFGVILILCMIFTIAFRAMLIGRKALEINECFSGFLACAIGVWFSFQVLINIAVVTGMLPTKGITLPFISYGGSSLLVISIAAMILLRIDFEIRLARDQAFIIKSK